MLLVPVLDLCTVDRWSEKARVHAPGVGGEKNSGKL